MLNTVAAVLMVAFILYLARPGRREGLTKSYREKKYRSLAIIASVFAILGWICVVAAVIYGGGILHAANTLSVPSENQGAFLVALAPLLVMIASAVVFHACAEGIHLAIDCATHLANISANTAGMIGLTPPAHPAPAADPATDEPAADSSAAP
jgi:hypothetical protein